MFIAAAQVLCLQLRRSEMCVHCAPTEREKHSSDWSYKHLAPMEPGKATLIERSFVLVQSFLQSVLSRPCEYEVSTACVSGWPILQLSDVECLIRPLRQVVLTSYFAD
jgi:hypothetical protein